MRPLVRLATAVVLGATAHAADGAFDYDVTFPDGMPGVIRARVEKDGEKHAVTCNYAASQEKEMGLADMPLGSWRGTGVEKVDRGAVRELCLRHYEESLPRD